ncbi:MAG: PKD domain-containing protein [Marinilabiliales bacterium]|nr:MAG: PKD domain-containing protein [Marinilabiliales bacterium]
MTRYSSKKMVLTFIFMVCYSIFYAQSFADFETPETTPLVENGNAQVVDNPFQDDINPSSKVLRYEKAEGNWHYVAMIFSETMNFGNSTKMTFKVHSSTQGRVYYKFWNGSSVVTESWAHNYHNMPEPNEWVELEIDVSTAMGMPFTRLEIAAGVDNNSPAIVYLDDFKFSNPMAEEGYPVIDYKIDPLLIYTDSTVTFDGSGSFDWNGLELTYNWDFGDGNTLSTSENIVTHRYASPGSYQFTLELTNTGGKSASESTNLFVFNYGELFSGLTFTNTVSEVHAKVEGVFQLTKTYSNPYDPDIVKVDAEIIPPDGESYFMPAFYYIKSVPDEAGLWVNDPNFQCWKVRFTPQQEGTYQIIIHLEDEDGQFTSETYELMVFSSQNKGFVYLDPDLKNYYRHSTGEHYLPIGENVAWSIKQDKIADYHDHISMLGENNANMLRYWTVTFASQSLEGRNGYSYYEGIGRYSQQAAGLLDSIFELCRENGIQIMLTMFQHGILSENVNSNWDLNPYNVANGGYLDKPAEFFGNELAKTHTRNLFRYYIARWGYSTNLFAWEFFNEVDLTGEHMNNPPSWVDDVVEWHEEMAIFMKELDPYNHITTTSISGWLGHPLVAPLGQSNELDLFQFHTYGDKVTQSLLHYYNNMLGITDLPLMCGEFGKSGLAETGDEVRNAKWVTYFNHFPSLHWNWDKAIEQGWYSYFAPMAAYFENVDLVAQGNPTAFSFNANVENVKVNGMKTDAGNFYYYLYHENFEENISGVVLDLTEFPMGYYMLTIYDPVTGDISDPQVKTHIPPFRNLSVPEFNKDIAIKLEFKEEYMHPVALAGNDQKLPKNSVIELSGEKSFNPKGIPLTAYQWSLITQPDGSNLIIEDPSLIEISLNPVFGGDYRFALTVSDAEETSLPDTVNVFITTPPVAVAGENITIPVSTDHTLDGSASFDPNGFPLSYLWTLAVKPENSVNARLDNENSVDAVFSADVPGIYRITLVVNDQYQDSEPDTIDITATTPSHVFNLDKQDGFKIYPNPVKDFFILETNRNMVGSYMIELFDISGKVVWNDMISEMTAGSSRSYYFPNSLESGIYFLTIQSEKKSRFYIGKIIIAF